MLTDRLREIKRPPKASVDPFIPYHILHEREPDSEGRLQKVNTIFLTNRECPFKCVYCDLWKHTLDDPTPAGAIPAQIKYALERLPDAEEIKLYNSGNFFDVKAIPPADYPEIAELLKNYKKIIVENHPRIGAERIPEFLRLIEAQLEVAIGVETIHPEILPKLNKKITREEIDKAAQTLRALGIQLRAFVLLNPPYLTGESENIKWCLETIRFCFDTGFSAVTVIPVRTGNGVMEYLEQAGLYEKPTLDALEEIQKQALNLNQGRVFADTWDLERFSVDNESIGGQKERIEKMNLTQKAIRKVSSG